jgi:hypothetical protein
MAKSKKDYHSEINHFTYSRLRSMPEMYLTDTPHTVRVGYHQGKKRYRFDFSAGYLPDFMSSYLPDFTMSQQKTKRSFTMFANSVGYSLPQIERSTINK